MPHTQCCTTTLARADGGTALPLAGLPQLLARADTLGLTLQVVLDSPVGDPHEVVPQQVAALLASALPAPPDGAWVVRRPGCAGLHTVIVFTHAGRSVAHLSAVRAPMSPEPSSWRLLLAAATASPGPTPLPEETSCA